VPIPGAVAAALAEPREAGTAGAAKARAVLQASLESMGYAVEVQRFAFSPSSLNAFPIFGAGLGWLALLELPLLSLPAVPRSAALLVLAAGLAALALLVRGVAMGWPDRGGQLREDANLIATRPGIPVRRWIVAHVDTKAQRHSMAGRLVAVWVCIAAIAGLFSAAVVRLGGVPPTWVIAGVAGLAVAGSALAGRGRLHGTTPGARDNASGIVAALAAAAAAPSGARLGILLTGAEEFGLVGARILAQQRPELVRGMDVINVDTVDERGAVSVVSHDAAGRGVAEAIAPRLAGIGPAVRLRRLPLGIFVDSWPLARAGARAVTIGRLDWATLRLLHTPRDTASALSFASAEAVGRALAGPN
jgi:hypothetical protein